MENYLYFIDFAFKVSIHAFVLMPNHFHLLITAPQGNLSEAMRYFMRETSRTITKRADRINQTYGSRFYRSLIDSEHYYRHAYKYVYRNPVEARLCRRVEDYEFSTLHGLLGLSRIRIPVSNDSVLFEDGFERTLDWLNQEPASDMRFAVRCALRKPVFQLKKPDSRQTPRHPLEFQSY